MHSVHCFLEPGPWGLGRAGKTAASSNAAMPRRLTPALSPFSFRTVNTLSLCIFPSSDFLCLCCQVGIILLFRVTSGLSLCADGVPTPEVGTLTSLLICCRREVEHTLKSTSSPLLLVLLQPQGHCRDPESAVTRPLLVGIFFPLGFVFSCIGQV